jgi:hypothetical protein
VASDAFTALPTETALCSTSSHRRSKTGSSCAFVTKNRKASLRALVKAIRWILQARSIAWDFFRVILGVYLGGFGEGEAVDALSEQTGDGDAIAVGVFPSLVLGAFV